MTRRRLVVSTVGISVFLKVLKENENNWRLQLNKAANDRQLSEELQRKVEELAQRAKEDLRQGDVKDRREKSAELNGLYGIYGNDLSVGKADMHCLIATDTALGRKAADVIADFLRENGLSVAIHTPDDLSAATPKTFSKGIKALIKWCEEIIPSYRDNDFHVIFNLTAAFKALQGYLNVMGMFYADEIVYIFEQSEQLLTIPRLPLQVDIETLRAHRVELAMMAEGHIFAQEEVASIPEGLMDVDERGNACISDWGLLIWKRVRHSLLNDDEPLRFPRLQYTDTFRRDFKQASPANRVELQEVLARVSHLLEDSGGDTAALKRHHGLQYEIYTNKKDRDGRPIGHFRVSQGRRISCTAENGMLQLRRYGEHSINDNP
ncbi:MAG: putative CRISPR-associated protein [Chloroflexus sp.]|nr:putative CRISPR-associated protein [Chloroflexus sp.]